MSEPADTADAARRGDPEGRPASDDTWQRVLDALGDERWDFRTAEGIAKASGLSVDEVRQLLDSHPEEVRKSLVPDRKGRVLYTLRSRPKSVSEFLATLRAFVSKST